MRRSSESTRAHSASNAARNASTLRAQAQVRAREARRRQRQARARSQRELTRCARVALQPLDLAAAAERQPQRSGAVPAPARRSATARSGSGRCARGSCRPASASFGTLQPSAANAWRKPSSLNCDSTDQVSGVATPGSASPTFTFDHTSVLGVAAQCASCAGRARAGRLPRCVIGRACSTYSVIGDRALDVARVAEVLLDAPARARPSCASMCSSSACFCDSASGTGSSSQHAAAGGGTTRVRLSPTTRSRTQPLALSM